MEIYGAERHIGLPDSHCNESKTLNDLAEKKTFALYGVFIINLVDFVSVDSQQCSY